jgi:hypothetical protein
MRCGVVASVAVALLFSLAGPAQAAPAPLGFGIQAVGHRAYFDFDASPGKTVGGRLLLTNTTPGVAKTVYLRPADVATAATGGLDYGRQGRRPGGTGRWLRLSRTRVRLAAGGAVEIPFSARVPKGAGAGDHFAGILAFGGGAREARTGSSRFRLRLVSRMAIAVRFRVPGPRVARVELRSAELEVTPTGASLGLKLANSGNALVPKTVGRVTVLQDGKALFVREVRVDAFVPGTEITYPVPWAGKPVEGEYEVRGTLRPEGSAPVKVHDDLEFGGKRIREFREETGRPASEAKRPSSPVLALLAAALAAVAVLAVAYVRLLGRVSS